MLEAGKVASTDTADAVGAETAQQVSAQESPQKGTETMDAAFEQKEGQETVKQQQEGLEKTEEVQEPQIDWDKYGLSNFKGRPLSEISAYLKTQNRLYGRQTQELGELRKIKQEFDTLRAQITGQQQQTAKPQQQIEEMSEYELAAFADAFNKNPRSAIEKFILPSLVESLTPKILEGVEKKFTPVIDEKAEDLANKNEWAACARMHPDYVKYVDVMKQLMTNDYIGENAEYEEAYKLAVMAEKEESLFNETCKLMKRGIPYDEAREYALLRQTASTSATARVNQTKQEVAAAGAVGGKRTATKQATSEPKITTMDEAFA